MTENMLLLNSFPKNKDKFIRLVEFCREIVDICQELNIEPVLSGSLAVFAYTHNESIAVNDIDLSCSEKDFHKLINYLKKRNIAYRLKEWHVLQVLKEDLKVEFDSMEYWMKDIPEDYNILQLNDYKLRVVSLNSLKELYKRGLVDTQNKDGNVNKTKHEAIKAKYEMLNKVR